MKKLFALRNRENKLFLQQFKYKTNTLRDHMEFIKCFLDYFDQIFSTQISTFEALLDLAGSNYPSLGISKTESEDQTLSNNFLLDLNIIERHGNSFNFGIEGSCELFAKFLFLEKIDKEMCAKFFLNMWKHSSKTEKLFIDQCQSIIVESSVDRKILQRNFGSAILSMGSKGQQYFHPLSFNVDHDFWFKFFFDALLEAVNQENREVAKEILIGKSMNGKTIFCSLAHRCSFSKFLDVSKVAEKFDPEFMKEFLLLEVEVKQEFNRIQQKLTIFHRIFKCNDFPKSSSNTIEIITDIFRNHQEKLKEILLSQDSSGNSFLHFLINHDWNTEKFSKVFTSIRKIKETQPKLLENLFILQNNQGKSFLHVLAPKLNFPELLLLIGSDEVLVNLLEIKDIKGKTILYFVDIRQIIKTIQILKNFLTIYQMKKFLLSTDHQKQNFLFSLILYKLEHFETVVNLLKEIHLYIGSDPLFFEQLTETGYNTFFQEKCRNFNEKNPDVAVDQTLISNFIREIHSFNTKSVD
jgi:hypothetical protein